MSAHKYALYRVNEKLYDYALDGLPENCTPLEEARYIYNRLCKRLCYSLDYYIEELQTDSFFAPVRNKMSSIHYVETVDGEQNKDVVCFVFGAILSYILWDRNLIDEEDFADNMHYSEHQAGHFDTAHTPVTCKIDGVRLRIDGVMGIDMDLSIAKYGNHVLRGWREGLLGNDPVAEAKLSALIQREKAEIEERERRQNLYKKFKLSQGEYNRLSLQEKTNLFFECMQDIPAYSFQSLSFVAEVFKNIFSSYLGSGFTKRVDSTFILENGQIKELFFLNERGYKNMEGGENFDSLKIYEISLKDKSITPHTRESAVSKVMSENCRVITSNPAKRLGSEMMNYASPFTPNFIPSSGGKSEK